MTEESKQEPQKQEPQKQEVAVLKPADSIRAAKIEFSNLLKATGTDIERFQNNAIMAVNNNEDIRRGEVSTKSIFNVCSRAANDGVMLDGREAALVIGYTRNGKEAQYRLMSQGIMKMINRSPEIEYVSCQTVHENDICEINFVTDGVPVKHTLDLKKGRGEIIGAYVVAKLKNGEWTSPEYMSVEEILSVRDAYSKKDKEGNFSKMWRDSPGEAYKKTVLHRAHKRLPITNATAISDDEVDIEEVIDITPPASEKPKRKTTAEKVKEKVVEVTPPVIVEQSAESTMPSFLGKKTDVTDAPIEDNELPL